MSENTELVLATPGVLTSTAPLTIASLTPQTPTATSPADIAKVLELLLPLPAKSDNAFAAVSGVIEDAATALVEAFPPAKIALAFFRGRRKRREKEEVKRRFQTLITLYLRCLLTPKNQGVDDAGTVVVVGDIHGIKVSYDLAIKIMHYVPQVLHLPALQSRFDGAGQGLLLAYGQHRFGTARLRNVDAELYVQMQTAEAAASAVAIQRQPRESGHWQVVLEMIVGVCRNHLSNRASSVDANYMIASTPTAVLWKERCETNQDALKIFGKVEFDAADRVLCVEYSMPAKSYVNFWVPVFSEVSRNTPGAAAAYADPAPQVVFSKHPLKFRSGVTANVREEIRKYFMEVPFRVFLSFPVIDDHCTVIGVVNVNLHEEDVRFLFETTQMQRVYAAVRPLLAVLAGP